MKRKVLVVDDTEQIHTFIRISLVTEGFDYIGAYTISSAMTQFLAEQPDIVVLDLGLPDGDGLTLLQHIRQTSKVPILILTARDQEEEKVRLLEAGANDYLSKPFGVKELMVRLKVLLRDLVGSSQSSDSLQYEQLRLSTSTRECWLGEHKISLTKKEFSFMVMMLERKGELVHQTELLTRLWGETHAHDTHYLRILVRQLRKKFNDNANQPSVIKTETGVGYRLVNAQGKT